MCIKREAPQRTHDFENGRVAGIAEAAALIRRHLGWFTKHHGERSPEATAAKLDLYCLERRLREAPASQPPLPPAAESVCHP